MPPAGKPALAYLVVPYTPRGSYGCVANGLVVGIAECCGVFCATVHVAI